jgi:hypothetical protein
MRWPTRLVALRETEKDKIVVAKSYNKKVNAKTFHVGDLVWKTILFDKWSPSWEGPYKITQVISGSSFEKKCAHILIPTHFMDFL